MGTRIGQQLGNYRLLRLLGQGAFADVYLAEHLQLGNLVAIKILQMRFVGENLDSFRKEARTLARLKHPHIVPVFDFDVQDGSPFLVMDYAPGGSLRQHHPRGTQLQPYQIIPYVQQVAKALQYAHMQRLVHRDVKPENMLLGPNGDVLLSDFGLVQIVQSSSRQSTKEMAGTVLYMAPEQIQGKPRPASDQYALGVVIYEWLTGEPPFQGSFTEVATQHLLAPLPSPRSKVPQIPQALERVVLKALAKDPQQRFPDVEVFARAMEQASQSAASTLLDTENPVASQGDEEFISTFVKQPQPTEPGMFPQHRAFPSSLSTQRTPSPGTPIRRSDDAETQIDPTTRMASSSPLPPRSSQDPLLDLSTIALPEQESTEEEDGERWMNLRWWIFAVALSVPIAVVAGFIFSQQQPVFVVAGVVLASVGLVLGLLQTMNYEQWFWFLAFVLLGPLTEMLYGVLNPNRKPVRPANVRQLVIVTSCLGYVLTGSCIIILFVTNNAWGVLELILLYFGVGLILAGWLLGLIRTVRLKRDASLFRSPLTIFAGIASVWNEEDS